MLVTIVIQFCIKATHSFIQLIARTGDSNWQHYALPEQFEIKVQMIFSFTITIYHVFQSPADDDGSTLYPVGAAIDVTSNMKIGKYRLNKV